MHLPTNSNRSLSHCKIREKQNNQLETTEPTRAAVGRVPHQIDVEGAPDCSSHEAVCPFGQRDKGNVVAAESYRSERTEKLASGRHAPRG